jgi:hypothetical protein
MFSKTTLPTHANKGFENHLSYVTQVHILAYRALDALTKRKSYLCLEPTRIPLRCPLRDALEWTFIMTSSVWSCLSSSHATLVYHICTKGLHRFLKWNVSPQEVQNRSWAPPKTVLQVIWMTWHKHLILLRTREITFLFWPTQSIMPNVTWVKDMLTSRWDIVNHNCLRNNEIYEIIWIKNSVAS